jgi:hypothetical protein
MKKSSRTCDQEPLGRDEPRSRRVRRAIHNARSTPETTVSRADHGCRRSTSATTTIGSRPLTPRSTMPGNEVVGEWRVREPRARKLHERAVGLATRLAAAPQRSQAQEASRPMVIRWTAESGGSLGMVDLSAGPVREATDPLSEAG